MHLANRMEGEVFDVIFLYFQNVVSIGFREDDLVDIGPLGGQYFLFDSTNWEYLAPQGYFAGHGEFFLYLTLRKARGQGGEHGDTGRRTIFRGRTGWRSEERRVGKE